MRFSKELYPKIALIKSAYAFTNRAYVHLDADETHYMVRISPKDGYPSVSDGEFENEMLAQCARHEIYQQTKTLRELLVARAMASTVIEISDQETVPVSEGRGEVSAADKDAAATILSDWFDTHEEAPA